MGDWEKAAPHQEWMLRLHRRQLRDAERVFLPLSKTHAIGSGKSNEPQSATKTKGKGKSVGRVVDDVPRPTHAVSFHLTLFEMMHMDDCTADELYRTAQVTALSTQWEADQVLPKDLLFHYPSVRLLNRPMPRRIRIGYISGSTPLVLLVVNNY
jgi:hypothetical protein